MKRPATRPARTTTGRANPEGPCAGAARGAAQAVGALLRRPGGEHALHLQEGCPAAAAAAWLSRLRALLRGAPIRPLITTFTTCTKIIFACGAQRAETTNQPMTRVGIHGSAAPPWFRKHERTRGHTGCSSVARRRLPEGLSLAGPPTAVYIRMAPRVFSGTAAMLRGVVWLVSVVVQGAVVRRVSGPDESEITHASAGGGVSVYLTGSALGTPFNPRAPPRLPVSNVAWVPNSCGCRPDPGSHCPRRH